MGKTHLAVAIATKAVEAGYRGYFSTADAMVRVLLQARREGNFATKLRTFTARSVLVVDDVGLLPIDTEGAGVFFHVVNARHENGHPTLVTTNRGLPAWGDVFGDAVVAAVISRPAHAPGSGVQHQRAFMAHAGTLRTGRGGQGMRNPALLIAILTTALAVMIIVAGESDHTETLRGGGAPDSDQPSVRARGPPATTGANDPGRRQPSCPIEHRNIVITEVDSLQQEPLAGVHPTNA